MGTPKLQFAIDTIDTDQIYRMAHKAVLGGIDIIEIGSPVITKHGLRIVNNICRQYSIPVYADIKTIDFPESEVSECLRAGATLFSVMIFTNNSNIKKSLELAAISRATAVFSTMGYPLDSLNGRIMEVLNYGAHFFVAHGSGAALEQAFADMKARAEILSKFDKIELALAGGITESNIRDILKYSPETVITTK